ncbi:NRDE family protein [Microbacterium sp. SSW1-59]|uniref:NRDE family protein n=1 Tax=Microbacterium xanthum TaxID=3079794 RepID=UPI002AD52E01|nr:NRDE family protein [Microbacterium sp. SSW1-59]MDZ8200112.1 NRDE family protein [Microbacterium sp. SSW1-59]
MCTVIVSVPAGAGGPTRLLAVRDEDPERPWNPLGRWWPERDPDIVGVRDARAGGAWLAARPDAGRLAVLLNRADIADRTAVDLSSRGALPLDAVAGRVPASPPRMHGFNLLDVEGPRTRVTSWDGHALQTRFLEPGVHMLAHDDVDDEGTARISAWLATFRAATTETPDAEWIAAWLEVLDLSAELSPVDDRAIIRDNRPHGYPTQSLLLCTAEVTPHHVDVRYGELAEPSLWSRPALR